MRFTSVAPIEADRVFEISFGETLSENNVHEVGIASTDHTGPDPLLEPGAVRISFQRGIPIPDVLRGSEVRRF